MLPPEIAADPRAAERLERAMRDHLWLHFTDFDDVQAGRTPIFTRGEGCHLIDVHGRRYFDGLSGLFAVQVGYSHGDEIGRAAWNQMCELPFYSNWSYGHPRAIELAERLATLAPAGLNRVFFSSGGSEAVETAWKLARQYHAANGERRWKAIARSTAYHGTTMGALSINGVAEIREPFEPLVPGVSHVRTTSRYRRPAGETEAAFTADLLQEIEHAIVAEGPGTVAMVILEPVQNAGGAITPPSGYFEGVREICDRYGVLLCADEVITAFGRVGRWFGSERYGIRPDIITCAKGMSSAYASIGAVIASDEVANRFRQPGTMFSHGLTFGGHPVQAAIALKNLEIMERLDLVGNVARNESRFREMLEGLYELPIVGDVRGAGYFFAIELVKDRDSKTSFTADECDSLLRGFLSGRLLEAGLICRADDRGDPVVQLSPPLIAGPEEFDEILGCLGQVLEEASRFVRERTGATGKGVIA